MSGRIKVGIAGWHYPDWAGIVYPKPAPRGFDSLRRVAEWFDVAEINSSFYRIPAARISEAWVRRTQDMEGFRFTAKLHQNFTHEQKIDSGDVAAFADFLAPMVGAGRFDGLLLQFPWSFRDSPKNRDFAARLFETFGQVPLIMEVRHDSWWKDSFFEWLRGYRVSLANIDQPQLKNNILPDAQLTGDIAYIRFHGRNEELWWAEEEPYYGARYDYLYSADELAPWKDRITAASKGAKSTIIIMNNHHRGDAVVNGMEIAAMFQRQRGVIPRALYEMYPERLGKLGMDVEPAQPAQADLFD